MTKMHLCAACAVGALWLGAGAALAGGLNPPAGPVAPTMKTLDEVEARIPIGPLTTPGDANSTYRISAAGSYYLTGSLTGEAAKHGIEIASANVTLDLNGFTLFGVAGSLDGVSVFGSGSNVTVRNGVIADWDQSGIDLAGGGVGTGSLTEHVQVRNVGLYGIRSSIAGKVFECSVTLSDAYGIVLVSQSVGENCTVRTAGIDGILGGTDVIVRGCTVWDSSDDGIEVSSRSVVEDCVASGNDGDGFVLSGGGSRISGAGASDNVGYGIRVSFDSVVTENVCDSNDAGGILVVSSDCRVDGNQVTDSPIGVTVSAAGNLIVRNTVSGCTTAFSIVVDNRYGAIVDISATGGLAVSGATATSNLTSTNPWANFVY